MTKKVKKYQKLSAQELTDISGGGLGFYIRQVIYELTRPIFRY